MTVVRLVQSRKAPPPMDVTLPGMVMEARLAQPSNALLSIFFTVLGMVIDVMLAQSKKALGPMLVALVITTVFSAEGVCPPLLLTELAPNM